LKTTDWEVERDVVFVLPAVHGDEKENEIGRAVLSGRSFIYDDLFCFILF
jgi:hypothetical protein